MAIADLVVILQVPNPRLPDDAHWETTISIKQPIPSPHQDVWNAFRRLSCIWVSFM